VTPHIPGAWRSRPNGRGCSRGSRWRCVLCTLAVCVAMAVGAAGGAEDVIIPAANEKDLHDLDNFDRAELRLFVAGNQFFLMPEPLRSFQPQHPEVRGVFYATLPPGLLLRWITAGDLAVRGQPRPR